MSRSRHTEAQMIAALKQMEAGRPAAEVAREVGVATPTLYQWKAKYGGMDVSQAQEAKQLRDENTKLRKLVADLTQVSCMNMDRTTDFLRRCANLPSMGGERREWPKPQSVQHLCKKYSEFVWNAPWPIFTWKAVSELKALLGIQEQSEEYDRLMLLYFQICFLRHALRAVWGAHNERDAFWKMVGIVSEFIEYVGADRAVAETMDFGKLADLFLPPAMPQALENAIWTLFKEKQRGRARICENPDCPARYYFAVRRDQRFCSAECAKPAQQAAKRTWWNQKGSAWRERKRREKASKPSGRKRS